MKLGQRLQKTLTLLKRKPRTRLELQELVGQMNSPELIRQLRKRGFNIETKMLDVIDRYGKKVKTARYYLK